MNTNFAKGMAICSITLSLFGCGGSSVLAPIEVDLKSESKVSFINATDQVADFHLKQGDHAKKSSSNNLFENEYLVASDIDKNSVSAEVKHRYKLYENQLHVGYTDSINKDLELLVTKSITNEDNYWALAWQKGISYHFQLVKKHRSTEGNVIRLRLFTNQDMLARVNNAESVNLKAGEISDYISVNNCASGLELNQQPVDLCQGDYGEAYLVVADENGMLVMAKE